MTKQTSQTLSIGIVGLSNLLVFFAGLAIQIVTSALFGAGQELDAFLVAVTVPNWLYLMINASFGNSFIPGFIRDRQRVGEREAWRQFSSVLNIGLLAIFLVTVLGVIFSRQIVFLVAPNMSKSTRLLASGLARVTFPLIAGGTVVSVCGGIFQAYNRFTLPALAPLAQKLVKLTTLLGLSGIIGIYGLATAETLSWIIVALLMLWGLHQLRLPYRYRALFKGNWSLFLSLGGFTLAATFIQSFALVDRYVASGLPEGSISYLYYGKTISLLIRSSIAESIMTVLFPTFAIRLAKDEIGELKQSISKAVRVIGFIVVPTIGVEVLRFPLVQLLAQRGNFTANDTGMVGQILLAYAGIIFAPVFGTVFIRALYALKAVKFVIANSALLLALYIPTCLLLAPTLGVIGIALTYSLVLNVNWIIMAIYLHRRLGNLGLSAIARSILVSTMSALVMGGVMHIVFRTVRDQLETSSVIGLGVTTLAASLAGAIVYIGLSVLLKREEMQLILRRAFDLLNSVRQDEK